MKLCIHYTSNSKKASLFCIDFYINLRRNEMNWNEIANKTNPSLSPQFYLSIRCIIASKKPYLFYIDFYINLV